MVKGKPEIPIKIEILLHVGLFLHQCLQTFLYREGIVGDSKWIDAYREEIPLQLPANVLRKAGAHHQNRCLMIHLERIFRKGNLGD